VSRRIFRPATARLLVVLLGTFAVLGLTGPAGAHVGGSAAGSNYDGWVTSVSPAMPGVTVQVLAFGDEFELVNDSPSEVLVPGYSDEPYLRIAPDGVWRNRNSPATYINLDRYADIALPPHADAQAEPEWEQISTQAAYVWHDHRTHFMSQDVLPPMVAAAPDQEHTVFEWTVPLRHGGTDVDVRGVLTWEPPPSPWTVWPAYAAIALAALAAGAVARGPRPLGALMLAGAAAALWHAVATPEPPASLGTHAGAIVSALLPALTAVLVTAIGWRAALRGRGAMTGLLAITLGWLLLVQGLPDVDALWTANVLSNGPGWLAQIAVALLVTLGVGLVGGGLVAVRRFREPSAALPVDQPG
jgi:hypothetical protein